MHLLLGDGLDLVELLLALALVADAVKLAATSEAIRLESELLEDDPELGMSTVCAYTESTKGVNMSGWSVGTYNIYRVPFKE